MQVYRLQISKRPESALARLSDMAVIDMSFTSYDDCTAFLETSIALLLNTHQFATDEFIYEISEYDIISNSLEYRELEQRFEEVVQETSEIIDHDMDIILAELLNEIDLDNEIS